MSDDRAPSLADYRRVRVIRVGRPALSGEGQADDVAAAEEPLEVRLHGKPFAVIMRTPGEDRALAAGFLYSEDVIRTADQIGAVEHCRHPQRPEVHNVVDVFLCGSARGELERRLEGRRHVVTNSSCGVCGRVAIDALRTRGAAVPLDWRIPKETVAALPEVLRERQRLFHDTGGLHAAGLFRSDGACERIAEDVGRHNAVDKVIGAMLLENRLPLSEAVLVVSGRTSFEIVQKAWFAGIGLVCAVSAPSSLAIEVAEEAGITLLGFVRDGGFNIYTHPERILL